MIEKSAVLLRILLVCLNVDVRFGKSIESAASLKWQGIRAESFDNDAEELDNDKRVDSDTATDICSKEDRYLLFLYFSKY